MDFHVWPTYLLKNCPNFFSKKNMASTDPTYLWFDVCLKFRSFFFGYASLAEDRSAHFTTSHGEHKTKIPKQGFKLQLDRWLIKTFVIKLILASELQDRNSRRNGIKPLKGCSPETFASIINIIWYTFAVWTEICLFQLRGRRTKE